MIRRVLLVMVMLPLGAWAAKPYKLPLHEDVRAQLGTVAVYARVDERGIGVERLTAQSGIPIPLLGEGLGAGIMSAATGLLVDGIIDSIHNARPMRIAQSSADQLVPSFDHPQLTKYLQKGLGQSLPATSLFTPGFEIKPLATAQPLQADAFAEPVVLAVTLHYALTHDLRCLHVQAQVVALSKSAKELLGKRKDFTVTDKRAGRVYRNLFDFYSDPLPRPPVDPHAEDYAEKAAEHLMQQWLADGGVKLADNLKLGTATVLELLARDLMDPTNIEILKDRWKKPVATNKDRVIMQYVAVPLGGGLSSEQTGFWLAAPNGVSYAKKTDAESRSGSE